MKSCIFLIILLGFLRITFCSLIPNVSEYEDSCPVEWFRRKRAEYTRWGSNIESTPEFIVKVLDEEVTPASNPGVAAVNIHPFTQEEKISVGGGVVTPPTSGNTEMIPDYTRFMPLTGKSDTKHDPQLIQPIRPGDISSSSQDVVHPYLPANPSRSANRDESPPSEPQFIQRLPPQIVAPMRQFAPVAPVAFEPPAPIRSTQDYNPFGNYPSRTESSISPSRTSQNIVNDLPNFNIFDKFNDDLIVEDNTFITRTSTKDVPTRTESGDESTTDYLEILKKYHHSSEESDDRYITNDEETTSVIDLETEQSELSHEKGVENKELDSYKNVLYNTDHLEKSGRKDLDYDNKNDYDEDKSEEKRTSKLSDSIENDDDTVSNEQSLDYNNLESANTTTTALLQHDESPTKDRFSQTAIISDQSKRRLPYDVASRSKRRLVCNLIKLRPMSLDPMRTLPEIVNQLKQWTEESPVAKWADITGGNLTTMENPIHIIIIDDPSVGQVASEKKDVLLVAGIHGRDHHSVASAMYTLYELIERSDVHADLLSKYRFWIIPVLNPDGYEYSTTFPQRRDWMKNLHQTWDPCKARESCKNCHSYGIRCTVYPCYGINLDRNFEYQWIPTEELKAEKICGRLYAGSRQMSEVETRSLAAFIERQHLAISVFVVLKEGDMLGVMYPYSHTKKRRAFDQIYRQRAERAAASANSIAGRPFLAGQTSEFLPLYAGGIEDWADGHLGIDNTYTIMTTIPSTGFPTEKVVQEAFAALDALLLSLSQTIDQGPVVYRAEGTPLIPKFVIILLSLASVLFIQ